MVTNFLLAIVARSADSIVAFVQRLDAKLETFLAQHDEDVLALEADIETIREHADADIASIRAEIADRQGKAAIVVALKSSLPGTQAASQALEAVLPAPLAPVDDQAAGR